MTPQERKNLAEQLEANPLFDELLSGLEQRAIERMIVADTEQKRLEAQIRVQVARDFRTDWKRQLSNNRERKKVA